MGSSTPLKSDDEERENAKATSELNHGLSLRPKKPAPPLFDCPSTKQESIEESWDAFEEHMLAEYIAAYNAESPTPGSKSQPTNSFSSIVPKDIEYILKKRHNQASKQRKIARVKAVLHVRDDEKDDELNPRIFEDSEFAIQLRESNKAKSLKGSGHTGGRGTSEKKRSKDERVDLKHRQILAQKHGGSYRVEKPSARTIGTFQSLIGERSNGDGKTGAQCSATEEADVEV